MVYTLQHIKTPEGFNSSLQQEVYDLIEKKKHSIHPSLLLNYSPEKLDIENHMIFSCLKENASIVAFCGIYNGGRYPPGVFRILNRSFIIPEKRSPYSYDCFLSKYILPQQLEKTQHLIDTIFVSRTGRAAKVFLEYWKSHCAPKDQIWNLSNGLVHVAPRGETRDCYQYICFSQKEKSWNFSQIDESTWMTLK